MSNERIKQDKLCENCVSRLICPVAGRACEGYNSAQVFRALLSVLTPNADWAKLLSGVKEIQKSSRGYRSNE